MAKPTIDILILAYNRPDHLRRSLPALLDTCGPEMGVWIWQNGEHPETVSVVREYESHPRVSKVHYSRENVRLREPTNWLWRNSSAEFVSKVDDDCLVPEGWTDALGAYFADEPRMGVLSCWHFQPEDFDERLSRKKLTQVGGGRTVLRNGWVGGSGYLVRRETTRRLGGLHDAETFTGFCIRVVRSGLIVGWAYPFIRQIHMDDPRAPVTMISSEEEFARYLPLSAQNFGVGGFTQWDTRLRASARTVQSTPYHPAYFHPLRVKARAARERILSRLRAGASRSGADA